MERLSREQFETVVFQRNDGRCEVPECAETADDAHHIIERDQWSDGGYYRQNGIALCSAHHRDAEANRFPPAACWYWLGIDEPPLPDSIEKPLVTCQGGSVEPYELSEATKYPSTPHLSTSPNQSAERNDIIDTGALTDKPLVVTTKMDGSNVQLSKRRVAARNAKHARHPSFNQLKSLHATKKPDLPEDIVLFGEWLYTKHSIHYGCDCEPACEDVGPPLDDHLQIFGAYYRPYQLWLGWDRVAGIAESLDLATVPVVKRLRIGRAHELIDTLNQLGEQQVANGQEGVVVRNAFPFYYTHFPDNVAKYVRAGHIQTDEHWRNQTITPNRLAGS